MYLITLCTPGFDLAERKAQVSLHVQAWASPAAVLNSAQRAAAAAVEVPMLLQLIGSDSDYYIAFALTQHAPPTLGALLWPRRNCSPPRARAVYWLGAYYVKSRLKKLRPAQELKKASPPERGQRQVPFCGPCAPRDSDVSSLQGVVFLILGLAALLLALPAAVAAAAACRRSPCSCACCSRRNHLAECYAGVCCMQGVHTFEPPEALHGCIKAATAYPAEFPSDLDARDCLPLPVLRWL